MVPSETLLRDSSSPKPSALEYRRRLDNDFRTSSHFCQGNSKSDITSSCAQDTFKASEHNGSNLLSHVTQFNKTIQRSNANTWELEQLSNSVHQYSSEGRILSGAPTKTSKAFLEGSGKRVYLEPRTNEVVTSKSEASEFGTFKSTQVSLEAPKLSLKRQYWKLTNSTAVPKGRADSFKRISKGFNLSNSKSPSGIPVKTDVLSFPDLLSSPRKISAKSVEDDAYETSPREKTGQFTWACNSSVTARKTNKGWRTVDELLSQAGFDVSCVNPVLKRRWSEEISQNSTMSRKSIKSDLFDELDSEWIKSNYQSTNKEVEGMSSLEKAPTQCAQYIRKEKDPKIPSMSELSKSESSREWLPSQSFGKNEVKVLCNNFEPQEFEKEKRVKQEDICFEEKKNPIDDLLFDENALSDILEVDHRSLSQITDEGKASKPTRSDTEMLITDEVYSGWFQELEPVSIPSFLNEEFPSKKKERFSNVTCSICFSADMFDLVGKLESCSHTFCFDCIFKWSNVTNRCPLCKERFTVIKRYRRLHEENEISSILGKKPSEETGKAKIKDRAKEHESDMYECCGEVKVLEKDVQYDEDESQNAYVENEYACIVCNLGDHEEVLLLCDGCDDAYHTYCVALQNIPPGSWFCPSCSSERNRNRGRRLMRDVINYWSAKYDQEKDSPPRDTRYRSSLIRTRRRRLQVSGQNDKVIGNDWDEEASHHCISNSTASSEYMCDKSTQSDSDELQSVLEVSPKQKSRQKRYSLRKRTNTRSSPWHNRLRSRHLKPEKSYSIDQGEKSSSYGPSNLDKYHAYDPSSSPAVNTRTRKTKNISNGAILARSRSALANKSRNQIKKYSTVKRKASNSDVIVKSNTGSSSSSSDLNTRNRYSYRGPTREKCRKTVIEID